MNTLDVSNIEALLAHYAAWLSFLKAMQAELQAKQAKLLAGKKQSPDPVRADTPAWLDEAEQTQEFPRGDAENTEKNELEKIPLAEDEMAVEVAEAPFQRMEGEDDPWL